MAALKKEGRTIFLNSHLLGEVELICDRVGILARGELVCEGTVAELTALQGKFLIGLAPGQASRLEEVEQLGYRAERSGELWTITLNEGQND